MVLRYALAFSVALLLSAGFTKLTIALCKRQGWLSPPRSDRWHTGSPALFGGVAIALGFALTGVLVLPFSEALLWKIIGVSVAFVGIGLYDDVRKLSPMAKLLLQSLGACLVIHFGVVYHFRLSFWINAAVTLLWIVGITNALNLLDNIDGLSVGVAAIAAGYLAYFYRLAGSAAAVLILVAFIGAALGFLVFNFSPAKIFMGDSGSLFIGFLLACVSAMETTHLSNTGAFLFAPIMILIIPIFDTAFVSLTRKLSGRAISVGGRDHTSHRLAAVGLNDRRVVLVFYFLSACSGMLAVLLHQFPSAGVSVIPLFLILITLLGIYLVSSRSAWPAPSQRGPFLVLAQSFFPLLIDLILLTVAYYSAFLLRFEGTLIHANTILFWRTLPLVIGSHVIVTSLSGIYWDRPVVLSLYHVFRIVRLASISTVLATTCITALYRFQGVSRVVFVLFWILEVGLLSGARAAFGFFNLTLRPNGPKSRTLILGSEERAVLAANHFEILQPGSVVGLLGTDGAETGKILDKFSVIGSIQDMERTLAKHHISQLVVATEIDLDTVRDLCTRNKQLEIIEFQLQIRPLRLARSARAAAAD